MFLVRGKGHDTEHERGADTCRNDMRQPFSTQLDRFGCVGQEVAYDDGEKPARGESQDKRKNDAENDRRRGGKIEHQRFARRVARLLKYEKFRYFLHELVKEDAHSRGDTNSPVDEECRYDYKTVGNVVYGIAHKDFPTVYRGMSMVRWDIMVVVSARQKMVNELHDDDAREYRARGKGRRRCLME